MDCADVDVLDRTESEQLLFDIKGLAETDGQYSAPINIDVINTTRIQLPNMEWVHYDVRPKKIKITNTGRSLILSAKWHGERPYMIGSCLDKPFVFAQIHFHWGGKATEGGEHTIDNTRIPLEMHAIHFKRSYLNLNEAKKHSDGVICAVYTFQFRSNHNPVMHQIVSALHSIQLAKTSIALVPFVISDLMYPFEYDYYMYWGRIDATPLRWFIAREVISISFEQLLLFRQLMDEQLIPIYRNWREIEPSHNRKIFHVNPAAEYTNCTLSPVPLRLKPSREMLTKQAIEENKWNKKKKLGQHICS